MRLARWFPAACVALLLWGGVALAEPGKKPSKKEGSAFGALTAPDAKEAQEQALAWLKGHKADRAALDAFAGVWKSDRSVLDKVAETLALGSPDAAKLLREARDEDAPAPTAVPKLLQSSKDKYLRANLALAYGRALAGRKVYEEALEALALAKPEDTADPSAHLFHKAVCEHALMLKDQADATIDRLLVDAADAPERYRMVAALMHFDMVTWKDKDLGWIARKMDNIQRRLDLKRGGKHTQKMQKEVLVRLDEMIKELENQQKSGGS